VNPVLERPLFLAGAVWNWLVALSLVTVFTSTRLRPELGLPREADTLSLWLLAACVAVLGLGYYWAGRDPVRNRDIVRMGVIGKLLVFLIALGHALAGRLPWGLAGPAVVDLLFAVLFLRVLVVAARHDT
jgi:hypothetical protein